MRPRTKFLATCVFALALLLCQSFAQAQSLDRGHRLLVEKGLQLEALVLFSGDTEYFDLDRWAESNFTTLNTCYSLYNLRLLPSTPPGIPWSRWLHPEEPAISHPEYGELYIQERPFVPNLTRLQIKDEQTIVYQDELELAAEVVASFRAKYPDVIMHTNQGGGSGWGYSGAQLQNYMQIVQPDMLMFDSYPFVGNLVGGSPTGLYCDLEKYRKLGLAGNDGSGDHPIPTAIYTQTYIRNGHVVSESEIRLNVFSALSFGYKLLTSFVYDNSPSSNCLPVMFTGDGTDNPTPQFYQVAETNRQSLNLGPALVRLISTDVRMKMGRHMDDGVPTDNDPPTGASSWTSVSSWDSAADPYITNITATNLDTKNDGLEGDVIVGYFKPLAPEFADPGYEDDIYFMIVNALSDATGSAADCAQLIQIQFDFSGTEIDSLLRLSRETGLVEQVSLDHLTGSVYGFDLYLDGGTGDLFKFNNGDLFVEGELPPADPDRLYGDANHDGVVAADDLAYVQSHFGNTGEPGIYGDANYDGVVSADDFASVQVNFGSHMPEPATIILLAVGCALTDYATFFL